MPESLRSVYQKIQDGESTLWSTYTFKGFAAYQLDEYKNHGRGSVYEGKVRYVISRRDGTVALVHTDKLSAFDRFIDYIPGKGAILNAFSKYWFEKIKGEVPSYYLDSPDERTIIGEHLSPFKVEVVVRGYAAGSMLRAYKEGERVFCGEPLEEGLRDFQKLSKPIITPTTKAAAFHHDEPISVDELIERKVCTAKQWEEIAHWALRLFAIGQEQFGKHGWLMVDTKYEFGFGKDGSIKVIDELHTPDSTRLWRASTYNECFVRGESPQMYDKQIVRNWLVSQGFNGNGEVPKVPQHVLLNLGTTYLDVAEHMVGPVYVSMSQPKIFD
jgi:phosphoribosylaminoimidazole-succinocarboxamide synthase